MPLSSAICPLRNIRHIRSNLNENVEILTPHTLFQDHLLFESTVFSKLLSTALLCGDL